MSYLFYTRVLPQDTRYRYLCSPIYYIFRGTRIVVTPELISSVLCVPGVAHLYYPSTPHFYSLSRDELASRFSDCPIWWGDTLNFTTHDFAKGLRILNMVMIFVLTPQSHYNTITKPCDHFLLSFE